MQTDPPPNSCVADIPCEITTVTQADGYEGAARVFEPDTDKIPREGLAHRPEPAQWQPKDRRAILFLHGIQSHGGWFLQTCERLRRPGHTVLAPDRRGSGLNQTDRGHCDSPDQLIADVDRCTDWLAAKTAITPIDIVTVSWSGKLALAYAAKYPDKVRSLALITPGLYARVDVSLKEKISLGVNGLIKSRRLHEIPLNDPRLFTANPAMIQFIENDPLKLTHATASFFITSTRLDLTVRKITPQISVPVYLFLAGRDRIIHNEKIINLLRPILSPLPGTTEPNRLYPDAEHTLDFETEPDTYFRDIQSLFTPA